jgi:hypothetical protein
VLSAVDALLHVLGHASYCTSRESLRWVCDSVQLVRRRSDLDWDDVINRAERGRLSWPASLMLRYVSDTFDGQVPRAVLDRLDGAADRSGAIARDVALFGARAGSSGGTAQIFRRMRGGWRVRWRAAGWLLVPSRKYVERIVGVRGPFWMLLYYVWRPVAYAFRALTGGRLTPGRKPASTS